MQTNGFHTYARVVGEGDLFARLSSGVDFEDITKGRKGNHLVAVSERGVPIVRTTTQYTKPAHRFSDAHHAVAQAISDVALSEQSMASQDAFGFNNALIEVYDRGYYKMGYHSDQALDLVDGSFVALYSCYEDPKSRVALRKLVIRDKTTEKETSILLEHDSVVLFSLETNTTHAHKIVLDPVPSPSSPEPDNRWLGITFRCSDTFVRFDDGTPRLEGGETLQLANEEQRKMFYRLRGQENRSMGFDYPPLDFTISMADTLEPR